MIPVCRPWLPGNEKKYVDDAITTNWISSNGKYIEQFEKEFAKFCGMEHGVACANGLAALHLACASLDLKKGDEVIVPTFTMIASLNAIILTGAKPVLVDCDEKTYCIDVSKIEDKINSKTKAIMPVHIYGHMCNMNSIMDIAKKYNLYVIEDAAEAHGAEYYGKRAGSFGEINCFSFYGNKIITTGEGGICVTNNYEFAQRMKRLRNHAFDADRFTHNEIGYNYRLTNVQAAIGCAQMENSSMLVEARRNVGVRYNRLLSEMKELILPSEKKHVKNVYWMYGVVLSDDCNLSREEVVSELKKRGIETRNFFVPMHLQPAYFNKTVENAPDCNGQFPVAERIGRRGFYLPSSSDLSDEEMKKVCAALREIFLKKPVG